VGCTNIYQVLLELACAISISYWYWQNTNHGLIITCYW